MPQGPWSLFRHLPRKSAPAFFNPRTWAYNAFQVGKVLLVAHVFRMYVGGITSTTGISMMPTIPHSGKSHAWILYSSLHRRGRKIKVGDIITYTNPIFPEVRGCKRVIGMPGDFVTVITPGRRGGDVEAVDVEGKWASVKNEVVRVPEGHCWVAGDNLEWSRDSRLYGPLPLGLVKAKVIAVILPFESAKWLGSEVDVKDLGKANKERWIR